MQLRPGGSSISSSPVTTPAVVTKQLYEPINFWYFVKKGFRLVGVTQNNKTDGSSLEHAPSVVSRSLFMYFLRPAG